MIVKGGIKEAVEAAKRQGRHIIVAKNHKGNFGLILVDDPDSVLEMERSTAEQLWIDLGQLLGKPVA